MTFESEIKRLKDKKDKLLLSQKQKDQLDALKEEIKDLEKDIKKWYNFW